MDTFPMSALRAVQLVVERAERPYLEGMVGWGQRLLGDIWSLCHGGVPTPNSYAHLRAAYQASEIVSIDWDEAPAGAIHYFDSAAYGQGGIALGNGLVAMVGRSLTAVAHVGKGVNVYRVAEMAAHLRYLGWSLTNGDRPAIINLTSVTEAEVVSETERRASVRA